MRKNHANTLAALSLAAVGNAAVAQAPLPATIPVTVENYVRAQTDINFARAIKGGGLGKFNHGRELAAPEQRNVIIRPNRDTLYSFAVLDLDAGPVTVTLPDAGKRFMGMQIVNQGQFTPATYYGAGSYTITKEAAGTRYAIAVVRFLLDYENKEDVRQVHALQDAIKVNAQNPAAQQVPRFPNWDETSRKKVQAALLQLGTTISDSRGMFGANDKEVNPIKHLVGSAMLWGGNPEKDALYLPITPDRNDGTTLYRLTLPEIPVDGFWSITVYDSEGYFRPNPYNAYSLNSITAKKSPDGLIRIQFGGCDGANPNCLPIVEGWSYTVRMFRPRPEVLDGRWRFPTAQPMS